MPARKVYHVTHVSAKGWQVKAEDAKRPSSTHETKAEAIARAKDLARARPLSQVIIHKLDGTIQTEHTYGDDPSPPKG